jgi:hypothetical protein
VGQASIPLQEHAPLTQVTLGTRAILGWDVKIALLASTMMTTLQQALARHALLASFNRKLHVLPASIALLAHTKMQSASRHV